MKFDQVALDKLLVDVNSVSTNTFTGKIVDGSYCVIDSKFICGTVKDNKGAVFIALYHKEFDIISIDKSNIFEAFNDIVSQVKALIARYQQALKDL